MEVSYVINQIKEEIVSIISGYIDLTSRGKNYIAHCPFHNEKTPSFHITPSKGIFKCFGCGKGGDVIEFIMEKEQVDFKQAIEIGAKKIRVDFQWDKASDNHSDIHIKKQSLYKANHFIEQFYQEQLSNPKAQEYLKTRHLEMPDENSLVIGYAPDGNHLVEYAAQKGINLEILEELGLVVQSKTGRYDFLRDRLIFSISNSSGQTIAFGGRRNNDNADPKYLNTKNSLIYTKGEHLYGLNVARHSIKSEDQAFLVEGYMDVLRLHSIGVVNTIATAGTALTQAQIQLLKKYTKKVTLIFDGDAPGQQAATKNAEMLIENQFQVFVIFLPQKEDPDSLFKSQEIFSQYKLQQQDYILHKVMQSAEKAQTDPVYKTELIFHVSKLISSYDKITQESYLECVSSTIKPKKSWEVVLKDFRNEEPQPTQRYAVPHHVSLDDFQKWGFYVDNNCYVFRNRKGDDLVYCSNFVMTPLFHIESSINAKRLFEIKNQFNHIKIIELSQRDMVSITNFKLQIESLGNFLWTGGESELNKLKAWLYEETRSCKEIVQMGWQKEGFFCWGNGIFDGKNFIPADKYGIVMQNGLFYYISACCEIYKNEDNLFEFERLFVHRAGNISLYAYAQKYVAVFGSNGIVTLSFYFACLFLDIISHRFEKFPILNMYGQKGTGKNTCAESILYMFGNKGKVPNLHNSSKPSIADHVASSANSICVLDEYRNDIEMEKRELIKGFWDRTGRTRMNMDKDKKKETSKVNQGIIICGQQIATADIALFSRFIALGFSQTTYSVEEKKLFEELEIINKKGLTQITHFLLMQRETFKNNYKRGVEDVNALFQQLLGSSSIETRIYNNWLTIAAAYATLAHIIELPFDYRKTIEVFVEKMVAQNNEMVRNDDLGSFWKIIQYLICSNILYEGGDFKLHKTDRFTRTYMEDGQWKKDDIVFSKPQDLLILSVSRVFGLYKTQALREGDKPLPEATIMYYLKNSPALICDSKKVSFKKIDSRHGMQEIDDNGNKKFTSTTALVFNLEKLNLNFENSLSF